MAFDWDEELVAALTRLGVRPTADTPPVLVKDFVTTLYRYELRRLREHLLAGEIPKPAYAGAVAALRPRYWMLSIPAAEWARPR